MEIKQTVQQINKEEEDDSESYAMPIFHIPNKAQRKLIQSHNPAFIQNEVGNIPMTTLQKVIVQKSKEKKRGPNEKIKSVKLQNKDDQSQRKKEGKNVKREFIQKNKNNLKEMKVQKKEIELRPKKDKRVRARKEVKIEIQVKRQKMQEQPKPKMKEKLIYEQKQQFNIQQEKQQEQKMQIQSPLNQAQKKNEHIRQSYQVGSKEIKTQKIDEKIENIQLPRQQATQENQESSSQKDSNSQNDGSESNKHKKTKKIKMFVSLEEKIFIWKLRYIKSKKQLKKHFFKFQKCPRDHIMRNLVHDPDKSQSRLACHKCKKSLERKCLVYWECVRCKYLVCAQCQGFNWRKCPYGHPTLESKHHRGQRTCDICLQPRYIGGLTCQCDFDMCGDCLLKAKGKKLINLQSQE